MLTAYRMVDTILALFLVARALHCTPRAIADSTTRTIERSTLRLLPRLDYLILPINRINKMYQSSG